MMETLAGIWNSLNWAEIVLSVGTTVLTGLVVWYRKRLSEWRKLWADVLAGLKAIPELQQTVAGIAYFVSPNGGGSLMDSAKRTETSVADLREEVFILIDTLHAENDVDESTGRFYCDVSGGNIYVNQTYARWLGVGKEELLGWGFMNIVHPEDVARVREHWERCQREARQYRMTHRMVTASQQVLLVDVIATPVPEHGPVKRWVGTVRRSEGADT